VGESQKIKEEANAKNKEMKLDHTIPLGLGGSNDRDNLKIVTTTQHSSYTPVENVLIKALKAKKLSKDEAQKLIVDFKNGKISRKEIEKMYK
jgi:5-methylcytosine-specific restriction endonuclease McrA